MRPPLRCTLTLVFSLYAPLWAASGKDVTVTASESWTDTGVDVKAGETVRITATGSVTYEGRKGPMSAAPAGLARSIRDVIKNYSLNEAGLGALIARIGDDEGARPFLVGERWEGVAPVGGRLFLGINQESNSPGDGSYKATIEHMAGPKSTAAATSLNLPPFTQDLLDQVPTRVQDAAGSPGDRVNFIIVGSRNRVTEAFQRAGWVQVDKDVTSTVVQGILNTIQKKSYVTMPMSTLMLFGRGQDFGYAQGDPVTVVAARHHFRLWQAPFDLGGSTVWAGAGTHDMGFDKDQRNNGLTHHIDPNVDLEREFIVSSLKGTGLVVKSEYLTPANPVTTAKTAHGEEFHSDGRTMIIYLQPDAGAKPASPATTAVKGLLTPQ
jgi:hypothetical protein